jgi:hypothetical protein
VAVVLDLILALASGDGLLGTITLMFLASALQVWKLMTPMNGKELLHRSEKRG